MDKPTLFPTPRTDAEIQLENAYQIGVSDGHIMGRLEGIKEAQERMREAQSYVQHAMGIREELGA